MAVLVRKPIGAGAGLLALLAFLALALSTPDGSAGAGGDRNRTVREARATSAPLIASDLAGFQERMRRQGRGYATDTETLVDRWLTQFPRSERRKMRDWTEYHGVHASATRSSFVVETVSAPDADGWFQLEVRRGAGRTIATCGGSPAPGCSAGHWELSAHGLAASYLLGR